MRSFKRRAVQGFTIVELMISLTIGGIAISSLYAVGAASTRHFKEQQRISTTQSSLRSAMNQIKRDFARAGFLATPNASLGAEACGPALGAPINNPATTLGAGRLAAISGYQQAVALPTELDRDNLNTRLAVVDDVILMGNYATSGEYMGIVVGPTNLSVTVPTTSQSFTRDFTNWYAAGGQAAGDCSNAALANAFPVGRLVRIRSLANTNAFAQVSQAPTCSTTQPIATIAFQPAISNCNATGGWVAPVTTLRYRAVNAVLTETSRSAINRVAVLRRSEVDPSNKNNLLMNGATPVDDRAVLDYVVRFTVNFIMRTNTPNTISTVPGTVTAVQTNPEFVRGAIIEIAARTAEHEPDMDVSANTARLPPFRVFTTQGAARTRSLRSEIFIPNVAYARY
jgi:prepilin-type N-terminal cleavage/methylation domain-containing protein